MFLCGLCEGVFPSTKVKTLPAMEEERRLAFVAMTRAQKGLYLSDNAGRNVDGSSRVPSRFVLDIDRPLLQFTDALPDSLLREARDHIRFTEKQMQILADGPAFAAGDRWSMRCSGTVRCWPSTQTARFTRSSLTICPRRAGSPSRWRCAGWDNHAVLSIIMLDKLVTKC